MLESFLHVPEEKKKSEPHSVKRFCSFFTDWRTVEMTVPEAEESSWIDSSTLDILKGFENRQYQLNEVQCVLKLENCCVHVSRDMLTDEIKALHDDDHKSVVTLKLKADTYHDAWLCIGLISSKYFTSRETFDDIYSREWKYFDPDALQAVENFDKITLEDSLKMFSVKMWCNFDYYLSNITEIEKDLGHSLENVDISDESTKIRLEKKLLFKNSIDIFGDINDMEENTESTIFFRDFRILYKGYGRIYATARRGHHYLFFMYDE